MIYLAVNITQIDSPIGGFSFLKTQARRVRLSPGAFMWQLVEQIHK